MLNLLAFFFEETETGGNEWLTWVILGAVVVLMIVLMIVPQRKQKKQYDEMLSKLQVGKTVTTIGGVVGKIVEINPSNNTLLVETGEEGSKTTMTFVKNAIHMVHKDESDVNAEGAMPKQKDEKDDEIK